MIERLRPVFRSLNSHAVKYVAIGEIAAIAHGVPRNTFDLDILIEATPANARRLLDVGLGTASLSTPEQLLTNEITIFKDAVRIDVQTATPGNTFADAWQRRVAFDHRGERVELLSKDDLVASKRAAGRPRDLEDVRQLSPPPP